MTRRLHIVSVSESSISRTSGMGRVAWHWREEAVRRGHLFTHLGLDDVPEGTPLRSFPSAVRRRFAQVSEPADCLLVHEPASGAFLDVDVPMVVVSHGIERRLWDLQVEGKAGPRPALRTRLLFPWWRLRGADRGLSRGARVYVLNREDYAFVQARYRRAAADVFLFRNGVDLEPQTGSTGVPRVVFIGQWRPRKGTTELVSAMAALAASFPHVRWTLAGTRVGADTVRMQCPEAVRDRLDICPDFSGDEERALLADAPVFVLPSLFEGQPLALLQAMAAGCCCVTTTCCGQRDVIVDGVNGLLVAPGDGGALTTALARVLGDRALRDRLGAAARASVQDRSWAQVSSEVLDDLEAFCARKTAGRGHGH
ncbi:MAG: glycosyltransferase family 4 protein [Vicinamibacterales bacterium]